MSAADPIEHLLDAFHARRPIRTASLIVTLFGDCILPRGGSLALASLIDTMALFRIESGLVRTAMSRLAADGLFDRSKAGRNAFYRLSSRGRVEFDEASRRIYRDGPRAWDGTFTLAVAPGQDERSAARERYARAGFAALAPGTFVTPGPAVTSGSDDSSFVFSATLPQDEARRLAASAWTLAPLGEHYAAFTTAFAGLAGTKPPDSDSALVARVLLVHDWRRIVLRDPRLPTELLPRDWPGHAARALFASIYRKLWQSAESRLDDMIGEDGPLRPSTEPPRKRLAD